MTKTKKGAAIILLLAAAINLHFNGLAYSKENESVKMLIDSYRQARDDGQRKDISKKLGNQEPANHDDMIALRKIFSSSEWDERLYIAAFGAIQRVRNDSHDDDLIDILQDEKPFMERRSLKENTGKSETEIKMRDANVWVIIQKLGEHKSQKAIPILKEYQKMPEFEYYASQALSTITYDADKASAKVEALYKNLLDESKKDQWGKDIRQLTRTASPRTKSILKKLFDHPNDNVRYQASNAFFNRVTKDDADDLIQLTKHPDDIVRADAVKGMMTLDGISFDFVLIDVLVNDPAGIARAKAARALGMKKIEKCVPYLINALRDKDYYVRLEAFIALYVLTDKKYEFNGREAGADYLAEKQKRSPTVNW